MTITTNDDRDEYTATSGQTVFNYTFKIYDSSDLNVYQTPSGQDFDDSADIITAYTVSGVGSQSGGTITLTTGATSGDRITIVSDIPSSRTTDYQVSGDFLPATVNEDFDRVVSLQKQAEGIARRSLLFPQSQQNTTSLSLPAPISGNFLKWRSDLSGLENHTFSASGIQNDVSVQNYAALRALTSSTYSDGQIIYVTDDGVAGEFVVKTGTVTDNAGTLIVFTDDSNRYAERVFSGAPLAVWFGAEADASTDDYQAIRNALDAHGSVRLSNPGNSSGVTYVCDTMLELGSEQVIYIDNDVQLREISGDSNPLVWCKGERSGVIGKSFSSSRIRKSTAPDIGTVVIGAINETALITNISQANPAVVTTDSAHGFSNSDEVFIWRTVGMTEVNDLKFTVANATSTTFELSGVDSTAYTAYTSGGRLARNTQGSDRCFIEKVRIGGAAANGATSGTPYAALCLFNPQTGSPTSYFHDIHSVMLENCNHGLHLLNNANANNVNNIHLYRTGDRTVLEGSGIYIDGAIENNICNVFHHQSTNSSSLLLALNPRYNSVANFVCEQGGASARGIDSIDNTGANNYIQLHDNVSGGNNFDATFQAANVIILPQHIRTDRLDAEDAELALTEVGVETRAITRGGADILYRKLHAGFSGLGENTTYKLIDITMPTSTHGVLVKISHSGRTNGFNGAGAGEDLYMVKNWSGTVTATQIRTDTSGGASITTNISGTTAEFRFTTANNGTSTTAHRFWSVIEITGDEEQTGHTYTLYTTATTP